MKTLKKPLRHCRLYGFVDTSYLKLRDPLQAMRQMIAGGVDIVQLRDKRGDVPATLDLARQLRKLADDAGVWFIVNDSPWIARECGADGVHLGQEDLQITSVTAAKDILGASAVIGVSTHSLEQALDAERRGVSYFAVGPVFATATKPGVQPVGLGLVTEVTMRVRAPVVAIGGINRGNIEQVARAGARTVAVVSDILCAEDVMTAALELKKMLDIRARRPHSLAQ